MVWTMGFRPGIEDACGMAGEAQFVNVNFK